MHASYKECGSCTLPYIDEVNGRDGFCDFCLNVAGKVAAMVAKAVHDPKPGGFSDARTA